MFNIHTAHVIIVLGFILFPINKLNLSIQLSQAVNDYKLVQVWLLSVELLVLGSVYLKSFLENTHFPKYEAEMISNTTIILNLIITILVTIKYILS